MKSDPILTLRIGRNQAGSKGMRCISVMRLLPARVMSWSVPPCLCHTATLKMKNIPLFSPTITGKAAWPERCALWDNGTAIQVDINGKNLMGFFCLVGCHPGDWSNSIYANCEIGRAHV